MAFTAYARAALTAALVLTGAAAAQAGYTAEYVFGDSLSDNGNLAEVFYRQNFPNPPSFHDSFTNGPVAAQVLATSLGVQLNPSLWVTSFQDINSLFGPGFVPGTNYAVAAATASAQAVGGIAGINLPQQVSAFGLAKSGIADPNALYLVMIGGNDVRNAALQGTGAAAVTTGVQTELAQIQILATEGARKFLVVNVPNVGVIPEFTFGHPTLTSTATTLSQQYDSQLSAGLAGLALPSGTNVTQFDLYAFNTGVAANAAALGFTDTVDPCYTNTPLSAAATPQCGVNGAKVNQFLFWDAVHPTAPVQALWGAAFAAALPEPSLILTFAGALGLLGLARRRGVV